MGKIFLGTLLAFVMSSPLQVRAQDFLALQDRSSGEIRAAEMVATGVEGSTESESSGGKKAAAEMTKSLAVYTVAMMAAATAREIRGEYVAADLERRSLSSKERAGIWVRAIDHQVDHLVDEQFYASISSGVLMGLLTEKAFSGLTQLESKSALKSLIAGGLSNTAFMVGYAAHAQLMDHASRLLSDQDFADYMKDTKSSWRLVPQMYKNAGKILVDVTSRNKYLSGLWAKSIARANFMIPTASITAGAFIGGNLAGGAGALGGGVLGAMTSFLPTAITDPIDEKGILPARVFTTREDIRYSGAVLATMLRFSTNAPEKALGQIDAQLKVHQGLVENLMSIYFQRLLIKLADLRKNQSQLKSILKNGDMPEAQQLSERLNKAKDGFRQLLTEMAVIYPNDIKRIESLKPYAMSESQREILDKKIRSTQSTRIYVEKLLARLNPDTNEIAQVQCQNYLIALYGATDYFHEKYLASDLSSDKCASSEVSQ